ncbi:MAG: redoxin family protein, partial [Bdellovibrionales bacterium]|nr:redoxin family protein [Bdellovibrionales bacterium]
VVVGDDQAKEKLVAFNDQLLTNEEARLAQLGKIGKYLETLDIYAYFENESPDPRPVVAAAEELFALENPDIRVFYPLRDSASTMIMRGDYADGLAISQKTIAKFLPSRHELEASLAAEFAGQIATELEYAGQLDQAQALLESVKSHRDQIQQEQVRSSVDELIDGAEKRLSMVGQPLELEGQGIGGEAFGWADYRGKVVLVDFWATWCTPCLAEVPNIRDAYDRFHDEGFEVVGVNLDDDAEVVKEFLAAKQLPWKTIISPEAMGFANPNAQRYNISSIPFIALIDPAGNVAALHTRGDQIAIQVQELLDAHKTAPSTTEREGDPPADPAANGAEPAPTEGPDFGDAPEENPAGGEKAGPEDADVTESNAAATDAADEPVTPSNGDTAPGEEEAPDSADSADKTAELLATLAEVNPYAPPASLDNLGLVDFILSMQDKPKSIQYRDGFRDAIVQAADRVLDAEASDRFHTLAAQAKLNYLHRDACLGDEDADQQLQAAVEKLQNDERPEIAADVKFFQVERQALDARDGDVTSLPAHLDAVCAYLTEHQEALTSRHLRLASTAVEMINRLDEDARDEQFARLGKTLADSKDKQVSRYGRRLARSEPAAESNMIGQPLEITGVTIEGQPFDWSAYRGRVVLVDFWATWCGPCRAILPDLQRLHTQYREQGFEIVGISLDEDLDALTQYLSENHMPWVHLAGDGTSELAEKYGVRGIPSLMLVNQEGKVVSTGHNLGAIEKQLETLHKNEVNE